MYVLFTKSMVRMDDSCTINFPFFMSHDRFCGCDIFSLFFSFVFLQFYWLKHFVHFSMNEKFSSGKSALNFT